MLRVRRGVGPGELRQLAQRLPAVRELDLQHIGMFAEEHAAAVVEGWPGLTSIDLSGCVQTKEEALQAIAVQRQGFKQYLIDAADSLAYEIVFGDKELKKLS